MSLFKIAGIDPGMRNTGIALAEYNLTTGEWAPIKVAIVQTERRAGKVVRQNSDDYRSGREMIRGVDAILREHQVKFVFAELPTGAQSARAAFAFGMTTAIMAGLTPPLIQVTPQEVKMASVGIKTATKEQMIAWAVGRFPDVGWLKRKSKGEMVLMNDNEHLADACAAIAAGVQTVEFAQTLALATGMRLAA